MTRTEIKRTAKNPPRQRAARRPTESAPEKRPTRLADRIPDKRAAKRDAILMAALDEFSANGFAAARLDDVARRAGVAKGTIYLYFSDKETLFQELVRSMLNPVVGAVEAARLTDLPFPVLAERIVGMFVREILGTRRKDVIRLVLVEGARFPKIAEFYYREVLERVMSAISTLLERAAERGEVRHAAIARFPQLLVAPGLVAILWSGLFDRFSPLDAEALMRAHLDLIFGERNER